MSTCAVDRAEIVQNTNDFLTMVVMRDGIPVDFSAATGVTMRLLETDLSAQMGDAASLTDGVNGNRWTAGTFVGSWSAALTAAMTPGTYTAELRWTDSGGNPDSARSSQYVYVISSP